MGLSEVDRNLLRRCLHREPQAWEAFVNRFLGLVVHVVRHAARCRSISLTPQDEEDLVADVFLALIQDDFAILRRFRGRSSLATYLTVIARRIAVRKMVERRVPVGAGAVREASVAQAPASGGAAPEQRISDREEVERLLQHLHGPEAEVMRMYHLEGKSYREISSSVGMPENSVGPTLSRARAKLRQMKELEASGE